MRGHTELNRRDFLKLCTVGSSFLFLSCYEWTSATAIENRPNILLIVTDDHGLDAAGCYGNPVIQTPHLDQLASEGIRFNHAFGTTASCSPSRSVLLTGLHNHINGMYGLQHDYHHFQSFDNIKSLPVLLSQSSYRTARIGKFHLAPESVYKFETVLSGGAANDMSSIGRSPVEMAQLCEPFIRENSDRPFFLYMGMDDPHRGLPFDISPQPNAFGNRFEGYPGVKEVKYRPEEVQVPSFLPDTLDCRAELAEYYQSTSRADQGIGKIVKILKNFGKYDNTVIIYLSDNGIAFPGAKTTLYDAGIHLPLIIRTPWQKKRGITNNAMVSWTDITPTILDIAGAYTNENNFHGCSFRPVLYDENPFGWDEVYAAHTFHQITMYYPMRAIRTRKYKFIWNLEHQLEFPLARDLKLSATWQGILRDKVEFYGKRSLKRFLNHPEYELYDILNDPDEIDNLANNKKYKEVLESLKVKLEEFMENISDPWYVKN
jgi:N-sulfoglucosamine sulfohydrolase